jgi:DNA-directed RNA polymerase subunit RPC12/RpoP
MEEIKKCYRSRPHSVSERGTGLNAACVYPGCIYQATSDAMLVKHNMECHIDKIELHCLYPNCKQAKKRLAYLNTERLAIHMRSHFVQKKYKCNICTSFAYNLCNFKRHLLSHKGATPYSCDKCGQQFTQSHSKKRHINRNVCAKILAKTSIETV